MKNKLYYLTYLLIPVIIIGAFFYIQKMNSPYKVSNEEITKIKMLIKSQYPEFEQESERFIKTSKHFNEINNGKFEWAFQKISDKSIFAVYGYLGEVKTGEKIFIIIGNLFKSKRVRRLRKSIYRNLVFSCKINSDHTKIEHYFGPPQEPNFNQNPYNRIFN